MVIIAENTILCLFFTKFSNIDKNLVALGGFTERTGDWIPHAEIYNTETNTRNAIADYPFHTE